MRWQQFRGLALRVLVASMLAVDAVVHIRLAPGYQLAAPGGIGQGNLFYLESAAAIGVALYVLARGSSRAYLAALVVSVAGLAAVVLYRYVDIPAFGPIPAMYEPVWFPQKALSALAQGVGAVLAFAGIRQARTASAGRPERPTGTGPTGCRKAGAGEPKRRPPRLYSQSPPSRPGPLKGKSMKAIRAGACAAAVLAASLMLAACGRPSPAPSVPAAPPASASMTAPRPASPMPAPPRTPPPDAPPVVVPVQPTVTQVPIVPPPMMGGTVGDHDGDNNGGPNDGDGNQ